MDQVFITLGAAVISGVVAWLVARSQKPKIDAEARLANAQTIGQMQTMLDKAVKDLDQAWMRIREQEHWLQTDSVLIAKLIEVAERNGHDFEGWNGPYAAWLARQK